MVRTTGESVPPGVYLRIVSRDCMSCDFQARPGAVLCWAVAGVVCGFISVSKPIVHLEEKICFQMREFPEELLRGSRRILVSPREHDQLVYLICTCAVIVG